MLTLTRVDPRHLHLSEVLRHDLDEMVDLLLTPWMIDFSHMHWEHESDVTS